MQNRAGLRLFEYMEVYQMDFTLSKQQQMVQKMYKEFAENEVKPLAKKVDAEEYLSLIHISPARWWRKDNST